ncbi:MAG: hypothetical protein JXB32_24910 [Deltaproteobacteria bacterium]|nr:hypothetical protein [Deltaproteobacteria bacterium]
MSTDHPAHILGVNPYRPPPKPRTRVAVDFNAWHTHLVIYEGIEEYERLEAARGTCDLVVPAAPRRRRDAIPRSRRDLSDPLEQAKSILVSARAATWAILDAMSADEIRAALEDLQRRIRTAAELQRRQKLAEEHDDTRAEPRSGTG